MQVTPEQIYSLIAAGLRQTTPIAFAAIGITLCEAAGVIHLSAEGIMLTSALTAVIAAHYTGSPWLGLLTAVLTGLLLGALMGVTAIKLKAKKKNG
jgi:simple sugar transport system permease protein